MTTAVDQKALSKELSKELGKELSRELNKALNVVLVFAIMLAIAGFFQDIHITVKYGGVDLRTRIVGTRLLESGRDPYFYRWTPVDDEKLLDPTSELDSSFTRLTVPPSVLVLHRPFVNLPYFSQRILWFGLQWAALVGACWLLMRKCYKNEQLKLNLKLFGIFALMFISAHPLWRLHTYVGQIYVFYVLLLSLAYFLLQRNIRAKEIIAGLLIGGLILLRPPIVVLILPMVLFRKFKLMAATLGGLGMSAITFWVLAGNAAWMSYFAAMGMIAQVSPAPEVSLATARPVPDFVVPQVIEGMNFEYKRIVPTVDTSVQKLLDSGLDLTINGNLLILLGGAILLAYSIAVVARYQRKHWRDNRREHWRDNWDIFFLVGTLMILIGDFLIPAPRYSYNDIQFLIPLFLIFKNISLYSYKTIVFIVLTALGFAMSARMFAWLPIDIALGQLLILTTLVWASLTHSLLLVDGLFIEGRSPEDSVDRTA
jgi:hypothetical protein